MNCNLKKIKIKLVFIKFIKGLKLEPEKESEDCIS